MAPKGYQLRRRSRVVLSARAGAARLLPRADPDPAAQRRVAAYGAGRRRPRGGRAPRWPAAPAARTGRPGHGDRRRTTRRPAPTPTCAGGDRARRRARDARPRRRDERAPPDAARRRWPRPRRPRTGPRRACSQDAAPDDVARRPIGVDRHAGDRPVGRRPGEGRTGPPAAVAARRGPAQRARTRAARGRPQRGVRAGAGEHGRRARRSRPRSWRRPPRDARMTPLAGAAADAGRRARRGLRLRRARRPGLGVGAAGPAPPAVVGVRRAPRPSRPADRDGPRRGRATRSPPHVSYELPNAAPDRGPARDRRRGSSRSGAPSVYADTVGSTVPGRPAVGHRRARPTPRCASWGSAGSRGASPAWPSSDGCRRRREDPPALQGAWDEEGLPDGRPPRNAAVPRDQRACVGRQARYAENICCMRVVWPGVNWL